MFELLHVINTWKNENANVSHIFFARKHESDLNKSGKRVQYKLYTRDFEIVLKTGNCSMLFHICLPREGKIFIFPNNTWHDT